MNNNSKRRTAILRSHIKDEQKRGASFSGAQTALLEKHGSREEDKRPTRGGSTAFRYCGV